MRFKLFVVVLLLLTGCSTSILVNKKYVIKRSKGIVVIPEISAFEYLSDGCVSGDLTLPTFFLFTSFSDNPIREEELVTAFFKNYKQRVSFLHLFDDCDNKKTKVNISESIDIVLDNCSDSNLVGKKFFLLPAYIEYVVDEQFPMPYLTRYSELSLGSGKNLKIIKFNQGYFRVIRMDVLEYQWELKKR